MVIIGILGFIMITFSKLGSTLPVELETCLQPWMSSLYNNCSSQEYFKIHCVLDDNYQPVIDCLKYRPFEAGLCPVYSKRYKELDARECVGDKSMCPHNIYWSHEVYKYPGCLNKTLYSNKFSFITVGKLGSTMPVKFETCLEPWMSSLYNNCSSQVYFKIHCVLDDNNQPVIDCLKYLPFESGLCPFYSKRFKELDARDCVGDKSMCPQNKYFSHEVYKYPGCLNKTLYVTEPPPTTSVTETSDELSENVTDTCVGKCSNGSDTTLLIVFLALFVVLSSCLLFLVLFWKREIIKAYAVSLGCHMCLKNANTGNQTESATPMDPNSEGPNRI